MKEISPDKVLKIMEEMQNFHIDDKLDEIINNITMDEISEDDLDMISAAASTPKAPDYSRLIEKAKLPFKK